MVEIVVVQVVYIEVVVEHWVTVVVVNRVELVQVFDVVITEV